MPFLKSSSSPLPAVDADLTIALAGNPNVGKSSIFNALTGMHQHTGNWPGKTVDLASGSCYHKGVRMRWVDLPGTYSLSADSPEEEAARDYLCFEQHDAVVVVCDATCLERNLHLLLQVLEITPRVVLCLNLMDEALKKGIRIDTNLLSQKLGIPVVRTSARTQMGLTELTEAVQAVSRSSSKKVLLPPVPPRVEPLVQTLEQAIAPLLPDGMRSRWAALQLLCRNEDFIRQLDSILETPLLENPAVAAAFSSVEQQLNQEQKTPALLLDELSQYMDLQYENNADGTVTVTVNGQTVVSGSQYDKMELMENPETGVVDLRWISSNESVNLTTGALKASVDYTNGRGPNLKNPGESTVKGFLYYQDKLNTFAQTLADTVNNIIPEVDENGEIKTDPATGEIVYRKLLGAYTVADDGSGHVVFDQPITADNLSISDEWSKDPSYIIFEKTEGGDADNEGKYALALSQTLIDGTHGFDSNGEVFQGTFLDYVKGYVSTLAEDVSFAENRHTAASTVSNSLQDSRDQVSGVVVDEEVANVMLYQKSLSAASRLMTAMDEALDVLINKTGLVGR